MSGAPDSGAGEFVLAVDTAARASCAAVAVRGSVVASASLEEGACRAEDLAELVSTMLRDVSQEARGITGLGVVTGPGSYTGLRVGLALVRGLATPDDLPVVGVGGLELLAFSADTDAATRIAVSDAGRGNVFAAVYGPRAQEIEAFVAPAVALAERLGDQAGAGAVVCAEPHLELPELSWPRVAVPENRAQNAALLASRRLAEGAGMTAEAVLPEYVGGTNATPNTNRVAPNPNLYRGS